MQTKKVTRPNSTYATEVTPAAHDVELEDVDAWLDEIDEILAQEDDFLLRYRAKGGE